MCMPAGRPARTELEASLSLERGQPIWRPWRPITVVAVVKTVESEPDSHRERQDAGVSRALTLGVGIGVMASLLAGSTIWLVVSDPVAVADAVDGGDISPLVVALASALYQALASLLEYL